MEIINSNDWYLNEDWWQRSGIDTVTIQKKPTPAEIARVASNERVRAQFDPYEVVSRVFPDKDGLIAFVDGLFKIAGKNGSLVELGGSRLRELLGFKTNVDLADSIRAKAITRSYLSDPRTVSIAPTLKTLSGYDTKRFTRQDLDFTTTNINLEDIEKTFSKLGFKTRIHTVNGGVRIVEVDGPKGVVHFGDSRNSWHVKPPWPMLGTVHAPLVTSGDKSYFEVNRNWGMFYVYPLDCPLLGVGDLKDPLDPRSVAAVGRALLWSFTITDPHGEFIRLPNQGFRPAIYSVVQKYVQLQVKIEKKELPEALYRGGIRDMSIALFTIAHLADKFSILFHDEFFRDINFHFMISRQNGYADDSL